MRGTWKRAAGGALFLSVLTFFTGCARNEAPRAAESEGAEAIANGFADGAAPGAGRAGRGTAASGGAAAAPKPVTYTVEAGTPIRIRTTTTLSTKSTSSGDVFYASLAEPLVVGDRVIAPRGADVTGRVVNSDPGGRVKGVASIALTLTSVQAANGEELRLDTTNVGRRARTTKKKDAAKIGIGSGVGAAIGAIAGGGKGAAIGAIAGGGAGTGVVMATHGDPAVVPAESLLTFTSQEPVRVTF